MTAQQRVVSEFEARYGERPRMLVRSPGRVNLIGEHTDYNDGFVMPMAIDQSTWLALSPCEDVQLYSMDFDESLTFSLDDFAKEEMTWREYPKAVAAMLQAAGFSLSGWKGVSKCDVPMGAGLSSSASFELAVARAFSAVSGFGWDAPAMAALCQRAENQWVGVHCGIMDQMIVAVGQRDHAVLIDCRSLETTPAPLPTDTSVVVLDTSTRRGLVESAYNERRRQCEEACVGLGVQMLRDITLEDFEKKSGSLSGVARRRARHVVSENERTLAALEAMKASDPETLGRLMGESHASLRDDFEVTNAELDAMVEIAGTTPGTYGARMTGAGFGGCAIALVADDFLDEYAQSVATRYEKRTGQRPEITVCRASNGAESIPV